MALALCKLLTRGLPEQPFVVFPNAREEGKGSSDRVKKPWTNILTNDTRDNKSLCNKKKHTPFWKFTPKVL